MRFHLQANIRFEADSVVAAWAKLVAFCTGKVTGDIKDNGASLSYGTGFINLDVVGEEESRERSE